MCSVRQLELEKQRQMKPLNPPETRTKLLEQMQMQALEQTQMKALERTPMKAPERTQMMALERVQMLMKRWEQTL